VRRAVLVVDDNSMIRQAICRLFTADEDFDVCGEAKNGREAIAKAQELRPDLIVIDLSMPIMNGLEATRAIKKIMPAVRIIMFTEYDDDFLKQEAHSAGISAVLSKSEHISRLVGTARGLFLAGAA